LVIKITENNLIKQRSGRLFIASLNSINVKGGFQGM